MFGVIDLYVNMLLYVAESPGHASYSVHRSVHASSGVDITLCVCVCVCVCLSVCLCVCVGGSPARLSSVHHVVQASDGVDTNT